MFLQKRDKMGLLLVRHEAQIIESPWFWGHHVTLLLRIT